MEKRLVKNMRTHKAVITSMLLVLFGSTIFQSCQPVDTSEVIYDLRFNATSFRTTFVTQHQNVTYEGDLFINNNETFTIQDSEFYMKGKITVQDASTLIIRNSEFTAIPIYPTSLDGEIIVLNDQAKLTITDSTLISKNSTRFGSRILVGAHAEVNITHSTLQDLWRIYTEGRDAKIEVNNSTIATGSLYDGSEIAAMGASVTIENSSIDGTDIWSYSMLSIKNSVVGFVSAGDVSDVNILDSEIRIIETYGSIGEVHGTTLIVQDSTVTLRAQFFANSFVQFTSSSVAELEAYGSADIMLIDSYAGTIETYDDATVFVGWHLPLFGLVTMDHTWVPIIQAIIAIIRIILIMIIIAVLVFFFRKRTKQDQRKRARTSEAKSIYRTVVCPSCKKRFPEEHHQCPWCGKILLRCKRCGKHISSLEAERYKNYCIECYRQWLQEKTPFF